MRLLSSYNIVFSCILILLITFLFTKNTLAQPGELQWGSANTQCTTNTIDNGTIADLGVQPVCDNTNATLLNGVEATVTLAIAPNPPTNPTNVAPIGNASCSTNPTLLQNCPGNMTGIGGLNNFQYMSMETVGAGTDDCTSIETVTIDFVPEITNPSFSLGDIDSGSNISITNPPNNWQDLVIVTVLDEMGNPLSASTVTLGDGGLPADQNVTEITTANFPANTCDGNTLACPTGSNCFRGIGSTPSSSNISNVALSYTGNVGRITVEYFAGEVGNNDNTNAQFVAIAPITWSDTLPITLAEFSSYYAGGGVKVLWSTATEAFNAGFYLYGYKENGDRVKLNEGLIPTKRPNSVEPQYYEEIVDIPSDVVKLGMSSVDMRGSEEQFGPYEIGATYGHEPQTTPVDWQRIKEEYNQKMVSRGYSMKGGQMRQASNVQSQGFLKSLASAVGLKTTGGAEACNVAVSSEGLYRVTYSEIIAAGCDFLDNVRKRNIAVTFKGEPVSRRINGGRFSSGSYIDFYGTTPSGEDYIYNSENVYQVVVDRGLVRKHKNRRGNPGSFVEEYREVADIEKNEIYDLIVPFDGMEKDPWYENFAVAFSGSPSSNTFPINVESDVDTSEDGLVKVKLVGVTDFTDVDLDHEVRLELNGVPIGEPSYVNGGLVLWDIEAVVDGSTLQAGENILKVIVTGGTAPFDLVATDSYSLEYTRDAVAIGDVANFSGNEKGYKFSGYSVRQVQAYGYTEDGDLYKISTKKKKVSSGNYSAKFKGVGEGTKYWVSPVSEFKSGNVYPSVYDEGLKSGGADVLIVTHPGLMGTALDGYESYIQGKGFTTKVVSVLDIYEAEGYGMVGVTPIRNYISNMSGVDYVVIVGGTTTEPPGVGNAINYVPTEFELTSEFIYHTPCDGCIVDFTGDYVPELKVFRVPAREESNIQTVTSKANSYVPEGSALLVAEHTQDSNFGAQLDSVSGELGGYGITKVYLDEVAANNGLTLPDDINEVVAIAQAQMIGEINGGQRLVMFDGHASPGAWTFNMLFTDIEAGNLTNSSPNVVIPLACYTTYYESPGSESLADQLLFNPTGGSVVVSGAAVLSSLVDNGLFAERILEKMCTGKNLAEAVFETKVENATVIDQVINWDTIGDGFATIDSCEPEGNTTPPGENPVTETDE